MIGSIDQKMWYCNGPDMRHTKLSTPACGGKSAFQHGRGTPYSRPLIVHILVHGARAS